MNTDTFYDSDSETEMDTKIIPLTLTVLDCGLSNKVLKEKINYDKVLFLLKNKDKYLMDNYNRNGVIINETNMLVGYIKKHKDGLIDVPYHQTKLKMGRAQADGKLSLQAIRRTVRHSIIDGCDESCYYNDLDIVNCHPVFLYQLLKSNNISHKYIERYVKNRDNMLKKLIKIYGTNRDNAKRLFISLMYGGGSKRWCKDSKFKHSLIPKFVLKLENEMKNSMEVIKTHNIPLWNKIKKLRPDLNERSFMSYYFQEIENQTLNFIYEYLEENDYIEDNIATLCFDGVMFKKQSTKIQKKICKELNTLIKTEMLFDLKFEIKQFKEGNLIDENEFKYYMDNNNMDLETIIGSVVETKLELKLKEFKRKYPKKDILTFSQDFFNYLSGDNDYEMKRDYFSMFYIQMFNEKKCIYKNYDFINKEVVYNDIEFSKFSFTRLKYTNLIPCDKPPKNNSNIVCVNGENFMKKKEVFIDRYMLDESIKMYNSISFLPYGVNNKDFETNDYNIFKGFAFQKIKKNYTEEQIDIMKVYLEYVFIYICSSDYDIFIYLLQWIKFILTNPTEKNGICLIFYSKDKQTGKGKFSNFIQRLIGMDYTLFGNINKLFARFVNSSYKTLLSIYDEIGYDSFKQSNYDMFKSKITEINNETELKNVNVSKTNDFNKFILLTNNISCIRGDSDETRFSPYHFKKIYDEQEFNKYKNALRSIENDDVFLKIFGEIVLNIDCEYKDRADWATNKPITEVEDLLKNLSPIENFMVDLLNCNVKDYKLKHSLKDNTLTINKKMLFSIFKDWLNDNNNNQNKNYSYFTFKSNLDNVLFSAIEYSKNDFIINVKKLVVKLKNLKVIKTFDEPQFNNYFKGENEIVIDMKTLNKQISKDKYNLKKKKETHLKSFGLFIDNLLKKDEVDIEDIDEEDIVSDVDYTSDYDYTDGIDFELNECWIE